MKRKNINSKTMVCMTLLPLMVSTAMTVHFLPAVLAVAFVLTALVTLFHPAYRNHRGLWMFLFTFIFTVPLNIRVISKITELIFENDTVLKCVSAFVLYCTFVSLEEIVVGVIIKALRYRHFRKVKG